MTGNLNWIWREHNVFTRKRQKVMLMYNMKKHYITHNLIRIAFLCIQNSKETLSSKHMRGAITFYLLAVVRECDAKVTFLSAHPSTHIKHALHDVNQFAWRIWKSTRGIVTNSKQQQLHLIRTSLSRLQFQLVARAMHQESTSLATRSAFAPMQIKISRPINRRLHARRVSATALKKLEEIESRCQSKQRLTFSIYSRATAPPSTFRRTERVGAKSRLDDEKCFSELYARIIMTVPWAPKVVILTSLLCRIIRSATAWGK
jgi:hypothetical protein